MSYIQIEEIGGESLSRAIKVLEGIPGGAHRAAYSALKRAGETAKTKAGQFAAAEYTITKGTFMSKVDTQTKLSGSISSGSLTMSIRYAGSVLPLLTFNTKYSRGGQLQTQVKRNGGGGTLQHAFVASIFGPLAVFERVGTPRFPVEQKFGPSTAQMMKNDSVIEQMDETIRETYEMRMEHEINRILNGWGG